MSDDKYYVPEITELHYGFECEVRINDGRWVKHRMNERNMMSIGFEMGAIAREEMRVPYLTHEDIVAEGWVIKEYPDKGDVFDVGQLYAIGNDFVLYVPKNLFTITIWRYNLTEPGEERMIFQGTIRNKSELRMIMKMLGIKK